MSPEYLVLDVGNTLAKAARFAPGQPEPLQVWSGISVEEAVALTFRPDVGHVLVSSVGPDAAALLAAANPDAQRLALDSHLPLPFANRYASPATLGSDRLAAVAGAQGLFPATPCLVIDAGSCITYDYLDAEGQYWGGNISPGLHMRLRALHTFTARLPLVEAVRPTELIGTDTRTAMTSGVWLGTEAEIAGMVAHYRAHAGPSLRVLLCGGDAHRFEKVEKARIFVDSNLVLKGLYRILQYHVIHF